MRRGAVVEHVQRLIQQLVQAPLLDGGSDLRHGRAAACHRWALDHGHGWGLHQGRALHHGRALDHSRAVHDGCACLHSGTGTLGAGSLQTRHRRASGGDRSRFQGTHKPARVSDRQRSASDG